MFSSPLRESTSRVVRLTPPDPSTFIWALHHLYTGIILPRHKKLLVASLDKGDAGTFWGLYENASFLDCATLMEECMGVLGAWVDAFALNFDSRHGPQFRELVRVHQAGPDQRSPRHRGEGYFFSMPDVLAPPRAVFSHPSFQPSNVGPAALVKMLRVIRLTGLASLPLRLFMLLSWLDKEECEGQQDYPVELTEMMNIRMRPRPSRLGPSCSRSISRPTPPSSIASSRPTSWYQAHDIKSGEAGAGGSGAAAVSCFQGHFWRKKKGF
jgi:hypothetical protein